jgi:hypothetical protein
VYMWACPTLVRLGVKAPLSLLYKEVIVLIYNTINQDTIQCSPLCVYASALSSLSYSSALYTIYLTWYQSHLSCGLQYSGIPASSSALHPAAALFRPTAPSMRYSRSSFGAPSDGRPSPANRAANSSGNFCPSLSRRHRHSSRPKEPPKVVSKPRIGGSVQSQPITPLHAHYAPHQTTDQTLRVQIRRDHRRPSFHAPTRAPGRICPFADALHALPRAAHGDPRAPTRSGTILPV